MFDINLIKTESVWLKVKKKHYIENTISDVSGPVGMHRTSLYYGFSSTSFKIPLMLVIHRLKKQNILCV
jgi:hypothetical protein